MRSDDPEGAADFSDDVVGSAVAECPLAAPVVRFVSDAAAETAWHPAVTLDELQVSARSVTPVTLPEEFGARSPDPRVFKIEVDDRDVTGDPIPHYCVRIDSLRPDRTPFAPPRTRYVALERVRQEGIGPTVWFRSRCLRLVVDDVDVNERVNQTVLVDWDSADHSVEILGQVIRVSYVSPATGATAVAEVTVMGPDPRYIDIMLHVLRVRRGGAPVIDP
jgi:hypothetical protein